MLYLHHPCQCGNHSLLINRWSSSTLTWLMVKNFTVKRIYRHRHLQILHMPVSQGSDTCNWMSWYSLSLTECQSRCGYWPIPVDDLTACTQGHDFQSVQTVFPISASALPNNGNFYDYSHFYTPIIVTSVTIVRKETQEKRIEIWGAQQAIKSEIIRWTQFSPDISLHIFFRMKFLMQIFFKKIILLWTQFII